MNVRAELYRKRPSIRWLSSNTPQGFCRTSIFIMLISLICQWIWIIQQNSCYCSIQYNTMIFYKEDTGQILFVCFISAEYTEKCLDFYHLFLESAVSVYTINLLLLSVAFVPLGLCWSFFRHQSLISNYKIIWCK